MTQRFYATTMTVLAVFAALISTLFAYLTPRLQTADGLDDSTSFADRVSNYKSDLGVENGERDEDKIAMISGRTDRVGADGYGNGMTTTARRDGTAFDQMAASQMMSGPEGDMTCAASKETLIWSRRSGFSFSSEAMKGPLLGAFSPLIIMLLHFIFLYTVCSTPLRSLLHQYLLGEKLRFHEQQIQRGSSLHPFGSDR